MAGGQLSLRAMGRQAASQAPSPQPAQSLPKGAGRVGTTPGVGKAQEVPDTPCSRLAPDALFLDEHSVASCGA